MAIVTGTFTSAAPTASSSPVFGTKIRIKMDFAGTASIDVEEQMHNGSWIKLVTATTADYYSVPRRLRAPRSVDRNSCDERWVGTETN